MRRAAVLLLLLAAACSPQNSGRPAAAVSPSPTSGARSPGGALPTPTFPVSVGGVVEYAIPANTPVPADCGPFCRPSARSLALGPDGNIWFTDYSRKVVGWISPGGEVKQFSTAPDSPTDIASGPNGYLYVTADGANTGVDWILRVSTSGKISRLSAGVRLPGQGVFGSGPESITLGPDGNLWFEEFWTNRLGRLTPAGALTEFGIPTVESAPRGIVAGPDGNMWFVESTRARPAIARVTMAGVITEFPLTQGPSDLSPNQIITGPDGYLWFTEQDGIARMSTTGSLVRVSLPTGAQARALVAGPDGNVWFADSQNDYLGRIGVTGALRKFAMPRRSVQPAAMAVGADGRIWFAEGGYGAIASIGVKVPEVLMSRRPLIFDSASTQSVSLRNTGEAPLSISKVRVIGVDAALFTKGGDSCAGTALAPDAICNIELSRSGGGPPGIQSALLEITDNATGSPQRLSLIAQVPRCTLPVMAGGSSNTLPQGEMFDVHTAQILYDANGGFENIGAASGVRTTSGGLQGESAGYYDRPFGRWLPVYDATQVSPDGSHYAYLPLQPIPRTEVHVVDVATGVEQAFRIEPGFWGVVAYTAQGIYLHGGYEGIIPGLWVLDPNTGVFTKLFTDYPVTHVDAGEAWLAYRNPADKLPDASALGGATNEVLRRDLTTGKTEVWLYRPGTNMGVFAMVGGKPIVSMSDGAATTYWILNGPNQAQRMDFPFDSDNYPSVGGFTADPAGVWVGSDEGIYLWTARTGAVLMTDQPATPAGTCA